MKLEPICIGATFETLNQPTKHEGSQNASLLSKEGSFVPASSTVLDLQFIIAEILDLKKMWRRHVRIENRIDEMVYDLYELTPEEIAIVEGK